jgi:hypothetical protein
MPRPWRDIDKRWGSESAGCLAFDARFAAPAQDHKRLFVLSGCVPAD